MKSAYIFHDAFSSPNEDWYPWMKTTLEGMGYFVIVPKFPTPGGQSYESWKASIKNYVDKFDSETIFIGHGTGGLFAIRTLQELSKPIKGLVLVASYAEPLVHDGYNNVNKTFYKSDINWDLVKKNTLFINVYAGEHDPFVSDSISNHLADMMQTELQMIPDGGHINRASGFTQLVVVAQDIKQRAGALEQGLEVIPVTETPEESSVTASELSRPIITSEEISTTEQPLKKENQETVGVHTMYQDMSNLINSNKGSVASSLLTKARVDEENKKNTSPTSVRNILYIIGTIISVIGISIVGYFLLQKYLPALQNKPVPEIQSIVPAEKHFLITTTPEESYLLDKKIREALAIDPELQTIHDIYYQEKNSRVSFELIMERLGITTVPVLLHSEFSQPFFMHGKIGLADTFFGHFLIIPVKNYDQSFLGMQEWEPTLLRDVGVFMEIPNETLRGKNNRDVFEETLIYNRSVRHIVGAQNGLDLYYFFINEKTLIITDRSESIPELLKRYANRQIYQ